MSHDLILSNIAKHISLDEEEISWFISIIKQQQVSKKELILREGQICKNISFVHSGILRAYHLDKEGKEATIMFALRDWWITDMFGFINQQPAMLNIEAIENSCIFNYKKMIWINSISKCQNLKGFLELLCRTPTLESSLGLFKI